METGEQGVEEFARRLTFSVLIGNGDMHLKNWSILYEDGKTPTLSPAYDLVSTIPYIPTDELALKFGGSKSLHEITEDQVRKFCATARIPERTITQAISTTIERTTEAWKKLDVKDMLTKGFRGKIGRHIETVAANSGSIR